MDSLAPFEARDGAAVSLTAREKDVLAELAHGTSTKAIAKKLQIAAVTVRNHIQGVLQKLDAHSKLEAVVIARQRRLA